MPDIMHGEHALETLLSLFLPELLRTLIFLQLGRCGHPCLSRWGHCTVVRNITRNRQQHYTAHSDDATALALCLKPRMAATAQCGKIARIQDWGVASCVTVSTLAPPALQLRITALSWSRSGSRLVAAGGDDNRTAFIFSCSRSSSAAQVYKQNISASASKDTTEDEYKQPVSKLFVASASVQHLPAGFPLFVRFNSSKHHRMYLSQPADVHSAQLNTFSGNDGAGEVWAVGDKMVKSCDSLARSCSKGAFGGNGVLQSALCVTFSSAPAFVITRMTH